MNFILYKETNFKGTSVGKIPSEWEIKKLAEVINYVKGRKPKKLHDRKVSETLLPYLTAEYMRGLEEPKWCNPLEDQKLVRVEEGDVIMIWDGSYAGHVFTGFNGILASTMIKIVPNQKVNGKFLYYFLAKNFYVFRGTTTGTGIPHVNKKVFDEFLVPIPSLKEQQKIAEILSTVDEAIQKTNEIIAKTERLKKGLMQELLTKGLTLGFMFDTNVFNAIIDKRIDLAQLPRNLKYYVTHIQYDEICNTQDEERRRELLEIMKKVPNEVVATEGAVYGVSKYGMAKYMSEADAKLYYEMLRRLKELDEKAGKKKPVENQARDVLIALTSIKNCLVLVTEDKNLKKVTEEFNGQAITFEQFQKGEYKEFRDTEMGRVPKHWKVVKLGDVVTYRKGVKPKVVFDQREPNTLPYLTADDVRAGIFTKWAKESDKTIKVNKDDVILIWDGFYCGDAFIGLEGILSSTMIKIEPKSNLNGRFLFYILKTHFKELNTKISGMYLKHVNKSVFENLKLPLPPLQEQQKIAEILSIVDRKLEVERNEKAKLERIKQGLMDLLLTGKIRVKVS
jgi:restriction endonuclease S subunit/predicted nucleic acid-binding protein